MNKKKGFTLIELIAVLVIMSILALIVTPLVMSIIRKAKVSADKRSIDAYGRSIELAIAGYLLDNGTFPTDVSQLTIEYSGSIVECSTAQINPDSSVYLEGCTVGGRSVDYTYGKEETVTYDVYEVGDEVTYNNVVYYVIKDSGSNESSVTLLKADPLSYEEIEYYSAGTGAQISNRSGYGGMQYGTTSEYSTSYVKQTVDAWAADKVPNGLQEAKIIEYDDFGNLGYEWKNIDTSGGMGWGKTAAIPTWVYNSNYHYYTSTPYEDLASEVWYMHDEGSLHRSYSVSADSLVVRPVIVLDKGVL